jgi:hypothetical protein
MSYEELCSLRREIRSLQRDYDRVVKALIEAACQHACAGAKEGFALDCGWCSFLAKIGRRR